MRSRLMLTLATTLLAAALALPAAASAATEWGSTARWPWSGYWWPMLTTDTNLFDDGEALQKYDQYLANTTGVRGTSQQWERANHATADAKNSWWGHCHAWAAAAILTAEPPANVTRGGVTFNTNDTKGLITELYYSPQLHWLSGTRVDDPKDTTSAAYNDIAPVWMDWLLRYYVGYYRYPFIMDVNANSEVWNFPVFAYHRNSTQNADGSESVTTTVWYSKPDYGVTGTKYFSRTYHYTLRAGTLGTWAPESRDDHPDFAWVPTGKNAMGHVKESVVEQIVGANV